MIKEKEKNMKKLYAAVLILLMLVQPVCMAAETPSAEDMQSLMATLKIMNGYPDGDFHLNEAVTRAQFAKIAVAASSWRNTVSQTVQTSPFSDVLYTHWAAPYIKAAAANKLVTGYPDSTFQPDNRVTLAEAVTVSVKLLGYSDEDFTSAWPYGQMGVAGNIGLLKGIDAGAGTQLTRGQVMTLMYNTVTAKVKGGNTLYLESMDYKLAEDIIICATAEESVYVGADRVLTTNGTYKINKWFNRDLIGRRGDAVISSDNELVLFFTENQTKETYNVYSSAGSSVILYDGKNISPETLSGDTAVYYNTDAQSKPLSEVASKLSPGDLVTVCKNENTAVEYAVISSGGTSTLGPVTVSGEAWKTQLGVAEDASVTRDGASSSIGAVKDYDVVYYSPKLKTVWAYSKKITGVYEKASPSKEQISTVTVSGVDYAVNSVSAYSALGTGGGFNIGDTITVLIGRDGSVVDAISGGEANDAYVVYSVLGSDVIVYKGGSLTQLNLSKNTTAYYNSQKTTFGNIAQSLEMGNMVSVCRNTDGSIDYVTVSDGSIEGPVTASGTNWKTLLKTGEAPTVLRDGKKSAESDIQTNDIVYYSANMNIVWAYGKSVTGVYEEAKPTRDAVTSVVISGTEYEIETAAAMRALSSGGSFEPGDTVTVLLGKDGKAADVISPSASAGTVTGYLLETGMKEYTDESGSKVSSEYVTIVTADGIEMSFKVSASYDRLKNSVVRVVTENGKTTLRTENTVSDLSGTVRYSSRKIGSKAVAENVSILDVGTTDSYEAGSFARIFMQRIDGMELRTSNVLHYTKNSAGEIDKIFLKNVTGDMYKYGIVKSAGKNGGAYICMVGNEEKSLNSGNSTYNAAAGQPVQIKMSGSSVTGITALMALNKTVTGITETYLETQDGKYLLSDKVTVYDGSFGTTYKTIALSDIIANPNKYNIEAYYDKSEKNGGRIRVLKVTEK